MIMETKRLYPSTQMVLYLAPNVLRVLMWVLGWQGKTIIYYPSQYQKALKMDVDEIERCLQALFDKNILTYQKIDDKWVLEPVAETFQKFYDVKISKVIESEKTLEMADKVTWNKEETTTTKSNGIDDMSDDEMERMVLMLQARIKERAEVKKKVVTNNVDLSDLPF